ncbi:MAG: EAL domain-containing protein [Actinomycetota bacterium]|nr:EAL domain-containing protein [Actinomycetota bacterium]
MITDFPIQAILDHLVLRIVDVLPITGAGVTLISPGAEPRYVAASDDSALRFEELQTELGEGPCLAAYNTGEAISVPDVRDENRFPKFSPRALAAGLAAVFTFPLRHGDKQLGALDLYRQTPGPLDDEAMAAAQTLADVAAAYLLNAQARADQRDSSDRYRESALHDALTGLPNRVLFRQRLDHAVLRARRSGTMMAVLFADLDRFKEVNDVHGHQTGDELLLAVARRLKGLLRPGDTLARLSGDEFVILCEDLAEATDVEMLAARIGAALAQRFGLSGRDVSVTASGGIAFAGAGTDIPEQLLRDADVAMYQAKRKGGARHQVIDLREQRVAEERVDLERSLRGASARGELRTDYQPIVATTDGRITGVEALLRWAHPTFGLLPATTVVTLAEQSGVISEIGLWVLEQACQDRQRWQRSTGRDDLKISVNVSAHQLMSPDFAATVAAVLTDTDTDPGLVTLEMTESVFVEDAERALVVLDDLKHIGVMLALDDFGTGYSSLCYLKLFPVDVVKIDQGFIAGLAQDPTSSVIVSAVVEMSHVLGMTVVAEGVETAEQHNEIEALGCESCQGFYFARPMPADDLETLMLLHTVGSNLRLPVLAG